ncbi:MAG: hypothetical protein ACLQSR_13935, partial [Limisphaerales bacterium]
MSNGSIPKTEDDIIITGRSRPARRCLRIAAKHPAEGQRHIGAAFVLPDFVLDLLVFGFMARAMSC